ncbi:MAG: redoxin domain-containing protein, partial [Deltaproteobacteria bacterium]|nr:redoxin domain-containing protein [Deltaproteobacteria bacterium]
MKNNDAITFRGEKLAIAGAAVKEGSKLPAFQLINTEMKEITDQTYAGKTLIVCVVPSVDTPVCSVELKRFNTDAASLGETVVLAVSRDLPFAQKRWCH